MLYLLQLSHSGAIVMKECDAYGEITVTETDHIISRGKVAFARIPEQCFAITLSKLFLLRFGPIWTFFRHTTTGTLIKMALHFDQCPSCCMPEEDPDRTET